MSDASKVDPAAKPRKAALILAGAAAKGPFAAGALSVVADKVNGDEYRITRVVGTSSGALNAAVFAAGLRVGKPKGAAKNSRSSGRTRRRSATSSRSPSARTSSKRR